MQWEIIKIIIGIVIVITFLPTDIGTTLWFDKLKLLIVFRIVITISITIKTNKAIVNIISIVSIII